MSYIGNADPRLLYPDNVRDDLIPNPPQSLFNLSQEVPGGYEGNVFVFKRTHKFINVIESDNIEFINSSNTIVCSDSIQSSIIQSSVKVGDFIRLSGSSVSQNNSIFEVLSISYSNPNITIELNNPIIDEYGENITIELSKDGFWETLQPEVDYVITGTGSNLNKQIQLSTHLNEEDVCYVIHKGSATYNFVPSPRTVGPEQLQENLRNFFVDRFIGDGSETVFELSEEPVNTKSIVVTVDGEFVDGDDTMNIPPFTGEWFLDSNPPSGLPRPTSVAGNFLTFTTPPANGASIRVLHLGFSTVSRRAALSDGQVGSVPPASIGTTELLNSSVTNPKLAVNSVSTSNIINDSVNGDKILLNNNQTLNSRNTGGTEIGILKLDNGDNTDVISPNKLFLSTDGTKTIDVSSTSLTPLKTDYDIGSSTHKFRDGYFSGDINVDGNINGAYIDNLLNLINDLEDKINDLNNNRSSFDSLTPSGVMLPFAGSTEPSGWLFCHGQSLDTSTYPDLFASIGYTWGGSGSNFNLPDTRQRFILGKATSGEGSVLGSKGGVSVTGSSPSIGHNHTMSHTHNLSVSGNLPNHSHTSGSYLVNIEPHSHTIPPHSHSMAHVHNIPPHYHSIDKNLTLRIPGSTNDLPSNTFVPPHLNNSNSNPSTTPSSPRFVFGRGEPGYISYDLILNADFYDNTPSQTNRWFSKSPGTKESVSARTGNDLTINGDSTFQTTGPTPINTGSASLTTNPGGEQTSNVSGNSGNIVTPTPITLSGTTSSISSSTTGESSPPWVSVNYIIKV